MAAGNFEKCHNVTGSWEGGWSNHAADPGGATMYGITLAKYREHYPKGTAADLKKISRAQALAIYRKDFWDAVSGERLWPGVDLATYDAGVNSGPSRALKWLMAAIGGTDAETVKKICAKRLSFVRGLSTWKTFGKGWSNRIADIEAKGVSWAVQAVSGKAGAKDALLDEEAKAKGQASKNGVGGGGAGAGVGGVATQIDPAHADQLAGASLIVLLIVLTAVGLFFFWRMRVHNSRADAYRAEAMALEAN